MACAAKRHIARVFAPAALCAGLMSCAAPPAPPSKAAPPAPSNSAAQVETSEGDPLLQHLVGEWLVTRRVRDEVFFNRVVARWELGSRYLRLDYRDCSEPPEYEAIVYLAATKEGPYISYWLDSFGASFSAKGEGRAENGAIEFAYDYDDGPFFNTFSWNASKGEWTSKMENQEKDGSRSWFATDLFQRRAQGSDELSARCAAPAVQQTSQ